MVDRYDVPKSSNMLSHLNNAQALRDYKYETARKLVRKQEELLRNLSQVRKSMEQEDDLIGKTKDYYAGSRKEKFGHTLGRADNLRHRREIEKDMETSIQTTVTKPTEIPTLRTVCTSLEPYSYKNAYTPANSYQSARNSGGKSGTLKSDIQKLKDQVENIANRYKSESTADSGEVDCIQYTPYAADYYPGASYVKGMTPGADINETSVSGADIAQYFPVTRYVLY